MIKMTGRLTWQNYFENDKSIFFMQNLTNFAAASFWINIKEAETSNTVIVVVIVLITQKILFLPH